MWTTLKILSSITVFVIIIGKNSTMEETSELQITSSNTNSHRIHECIKYEREKLIGIALKCKQDNWYKILNKETCVKIGNYRLNRRYKRGTLQVMKQNIVISFPTL